VDLSRALRDVADAVLAAPTVVPVGARTHWGIGGAVAAAREIRAPAGIVRHDPADMTVTVGAGTPFAELDDALARHGQECPLDPGAEHATVGGILAAGVSGWRRRRHGPVRDQVLEVRFVTGDGRTVKGGGPTVKNVTGYDLPRLLVGSLGTLGVLGQVTLRCRPRPAAAGWVTRPGLVSDDVFRAASVLWDGTRTVVRLEGAARDVTEQSRGWSECDPPAPPAGPYRGRISVAPGALAALADALGALDRVSWLAEVGVGTVHVGARDAAGLRGARTAAQRLGGWLLREAGEEVEAFGRPMPDAALMRRIKAAFDPDGRLAPGRLPL
jgi:glycolate oxidase FAD binding subunit